MPLRALLPLLLSACAAGELPEPADEPAPAPEQAATPGPRPLAATGPAPDVVAAETVQPPGPAEPVEGADAEKLAQAAALRDQGDLPGMQKALLELLRDHPQSPLVPHAYLMIGEAMFNRGDFAAALRLFAKVLTYPEHDLAAYALYRSAWCHLDLHDDAAALHAFITAAQRAQLTGDTGHRIVGASIRDSVAAFVRVGELETSRSFYGRLVRGTAVSLDDILGRVASAAIDGGRGDELARVCQAEGSPPWCAGPLTSPPTQLRRVPVGDTGPERR